MSSLVHLQVHGDIGKTGELRIWLVICFAVLLPCSWLGTPKEFWGIAVGASLATAVACLMICVCIGLDLPADLKTVQQPIVNFESFFSGIKTACQLNWTITQNYYIDNVVFFYEAHISILFPHKYFFVLHVIFSTSRFLPYIF